MRNFLFLSLAMVLLLSACHKSTSHPGGFVGEWQLTRIVGGPLIDVAPISRESVTILRLLPDSTSEVYYNNRLVNRSFWSVLQVGIATPATVMAFRATAGSRDTAFLYSASLTGDKMLLQQQNVSPDLFYQATYTRR